MAESSRIAWTDHTWNPWIGCEKVSPGCANCYAESYVTRRLQWHVWGRDAPRRRTADSTWANVLRWQRRAAGGAVGVMGKGYPQLVFTGSLMDWAEDRPELAAIRAEMFQVIRECPNLHFQLLTKRPECIWGSLPLDWSLATYPNVWLGTSVESMEYAWRVDELRHIPATVRFISYEPALGPLDGIDLANIDWLIYGGESGPKFRRDTPEWSWSIQRTCEAFGTAYFFKQTAARYPGTKGAADVPQHFPVQCLWLPPECPTGKVK